jgi:hypothetical protein
MSEWIENCSANGRCKCFILALRDIRINSFEVDWGLFGQVLEVGIGILNEIVRLGFGVITMDGQDIYPQFDNDGISDSECVSSIPSSDPFDNNCSSSVYDRVISWLSSTGIVGVDNVARDLQSHRDIGQGLHVHFSSTARYSLVH